MCLQVAIVIVEFMHVTVILSCSAIFMIIKWHVLNQIHADVKCGFELYHTYINIANGSYYEFNNFMHINFG